MRLWSLTQHFDSLAGFERWRVEKWYYTVARTGMCPRLLDTISVRTPKWVNEGGDYFGVTGGLGQFTKHKNEAILTWR